MTWRSRCQDRPGGNPPRIRRCAPAPGLRPAPRRSPAQRHEDRPSGSAWSLECPGSASGSAVRRPRRPPLPGPHRYPAWRRRSGSRRPPQGPRLRARAWLCRWREARTHAAPVRRPPAGPGGAPPPVARDRRRADVQQVGAFRLQAQRVGDGRVRLVVPPAVREGVGRNIDDPHQERVRTEDKRTPSRQREPDLPGNRWGLQCANSPEPVRSRHHGRSR